MRKKVTQADILAFLKLKKPQLETLYHVSSIALFGSYARGEESEQSDIDIVLEFSPGTDNIFEMKAALKNLISQEFGRSVDICREKYLKPYYREQILKSAIYV